MHMGTALRAAVAAVLLLAVPSSARATDAIVVRWRIDPHGRATGVILEDGTAFATRPAVTMQLLQLVRLGDRVHTSQTPQGTEELRNLRTGQVVDLGPSDRVARGGGPLDPDPAVPYARVDDARGLQTLRVAARVARIIHAPGAISPSGLLMEDGTQVYLVPGVATGLRSVRPGQALRVEGRGTMTPQGASLWAVTISRPTGHVLLDMTRGIGAPELRLGAVR
jgi:hypothetical protein